MNERHLGSDFDDFLREEGLLDDAEAVAAKRVLAFQISKEIEQQALSKTGMAGPTCSRLLPPAFRGPRG